MTATYTLQREQFIPRPLEDVFAFFADATNLEAITPPSLRFRILTPLPIDMREGTLIDYRLRVRGVPIRWRTRIEEFQPLQRFIDIQIRGPYRLWRHLHEFRETRGGTRMLDRVEYALPWGPLGTLAHAAFVRHELDHIFNYRRQRITGLLAADRPIAAPSS